MPSNEDLSNRAKQLVTDVQALSLSAKQHVEEYKALSNEAYANIQAYLKSKGVATVDEWLAVCQKQLSTDDAAKVQKTLRDLEPPQGLAALVQPTEIAKFIASWYIIEGALPLFQAAALSAKAWYYNYLVINRLPVVQVAELAGEVEVSSLASTAEELGEAAEFIESEEVGTLVVAAEAEVGEVVAADAAIAAEAATVAAAEAASVWNVVFLAVGAVVLAGTIAYQKVKESQNADKLRDIIAKVSTARLYALVADKCMLVQTDSHSILRLLNTALKENNTDAEDFFKKNAFNTVKTGTAAVDVRACYDQLRQQDENVHSMTEADPSFDDMVRQHDREVQDARDKAKR